MSGKGIYLYSAGADLLPVFHHVEAQGQLIYVRAGLFPDSAPQKFGSGQELPGQGMTALDDPTQEETYLVADARTNIRARTVPQTGGGNLYAFDQMDNPHTIALRPGGIHGDSCVVAGELSTISPHDESIALYHRFASRIRSAFKKVRSYWVGPEALAILQAGGRLTPSVRASRILDLKAL